MIKHLILSLIIISFLTEGCKDSSEMPEYKPYITPGLKAADFMARTLDNKFENFSKFRGKVVIMPFWRKRYEDCIENLNNLEKVYNNYKEKGLEVVAINGDNLDYVPSKRIIEFAKEKGYSFHVWLDDQIQATQRYKVIKVPVTFVIDREGIIRFIEYGTVNWETPENKAKIEKLL